MDDLSKRRWWLIAVAALLAALMLRDSFGGWIGGGLVALGIVAVAGWEWSRRGKSSARPTGGPRPTWCLKCGEALPAGARQCEACGSASWTYKN